MTVVTSSAHFVASTTPMPSSGVVGQTVFKDSATLGATTTDRKVTFKLWGPGTSCTGTPAFTDALEPVSAAQGNGSVPVISKGFVASQAGHYEWTAEIINGSSVEFTSKCGDEPITVKNAQKAVEIDTKPSGGGPTGTVLSDRATVSNLVQPTTGTVTFKLFGPSSESCSGTPVWVSAAVPVDEAGIAKSGLTPASATDTAGTYQWVAKFSGDANNSSATSGCGSEPVVITKQHTPPPTPTPTPVPTPQPPVSQVQALNTPTTGLDPWTSIGLGGLLFLGGPAVAMSGLLLRQRRDRSGK